MSFDDFDDESWMAGLDTPTTGNNFHRGRGGGRTNGASGTTNGNRWGGGGRMVPDLRTCHKCQQRGHLARDCKNPRAATQNGRTGFGLPGPNTASSTFHALTTGLQSTASQNSRTGFGLPRSDTATLPAHTTALQSTAYTKASQNQHVCYNCQKPGHVSRNCPEPKSNNRSGLSTGSAQASQSEQVCHNCQKPGHMSRNCQEPKSNNRSGPPNGRPTFGFMRLHAFLTTDEADAVIMAIGRNIPEWVKLFEPSSINSQSDDFFPLILHILAKKVCSQETILKPNQISIITSTFHDTFTKQLQKLITTMFMGEMRNRSNGMVVDTTRIGVLGSIYTVFVFVNLRCPSVARDYLAPLIPGAIGLLSTLLVIGGGPTEEELLANFNKLLQTINSIRRKAEEEDVTRKKFNKYELTDLEESSLHDMAPPDDFREIPIIPTIQEILSTEEPFLRTNRKTGRYKDADHYLDVQFRLLREDFVNPLKKGIQDFMKNRADYLSRKKKLPIGSVRLYPDTTIKNVALIRDALTYSIQLPVATVGRIKWEKSKRLLNGSLLVFTHDNFKSAYFGIVARRDIPQLQQGILGITWEGDPPEFDKTFLMVECEVYFEAYRHTLEILKTIELDKFPLAKFIVESSDHVVAPKYLEEATHQMLIGEHHFSPLAGPWPTAKTLGLDYDQFLAYQAALTKEFSIIQGPPGTGKTYLGLRVAETFLRNLDCWWREKKGPILVVCYTNHALDQFLEGILGILKELNPKEEPGLIRVGGRSKCEALDEFSLAKKRITASRMRMYDRGFSEAQHEARWSLRELESERATIIGQAVGFGNLDGIVKIDAYAKGLKDVISSNVLSVMKKLEWFGLSNVDFHAASFSASELIRKWFQVTPAKAPTAKPTPEVAAAAAREKSDTEDEEDYDLGELLENRMDDEEIQFEMSNSQANNGGSIEYVDMCSVAKCQHAIRNAQHAMESLSDPTKQLTHIQKAQETRKLSAEIRSAENRIQFFELLMKSQRDGLLQLTDMSNLIGPDNLLTLPQLNVLPLSQRWSIYFAVMDKARIRAVQATAEVSKSLVLAQKKLDSIRRTGDGQLLRKTQVVGMTTTGAAKNHDLLQMMQSKIVIVEEAAEVLESHIVTCITEYCQHLILIGDHQQLRPSTTVYDLSVKYHLDISLFERMINNNLNCYRLKVQHRMRPEIANLVVGTIYTELNNHHSVNDYPDVKGLDKNLFFIDHQEHEKSEADSMSKSNEHEAKFLAALCRHLILQGYEPSEITVLTTYTGQMFLLKKEISSVYSCNGIRVTVVDNYQGEENKIILLSLVRSNEDNNIGFLKTDNRICVAISRAKHGLYICGNMSNLTARSKTWKQIREKLTARGEIGQELKLLCEIHGTMASVTKPGDFRTKSPEGGCTALCKTVLKCTHECESACHIADREHALYKCRKPCLKSCVSDHPCREKCFVRCPPCNVQMEKTLPCQHVLALPCHKDPAEVKCLVLVDKAKPCGHVEKMTCYTNPASVRCREVVLKTLPCTHIKSAECHFDPGLITCRVPVTKVLVPCGHEQIAECRMHPEMISCDTEVEKEFADCKHKLKLKCKDSKNLALYCKVACPNRLECGHQCTKICHVLEDPHHVNYKCIKRCAKSCENGHPCVTNHKCSTACPPCEMKMEKVLSCLTHKSVIACKVPVGSVLCKEKCEQRLAICNHKCTKKCYEECLPCQTSVFKRSLCGHNQLVKCSEPASPTRCEENVKPRQMSACLHGEALVPCKLKESISPNEIMDYCNRPCGYQFEDKNPKGCHHKCKGSCAECLQGRLHKKCQDECGRVLVCGHVCTFPCSSVCPPCQKECFMKCEHSACRAICGAPCTDCKEKCSWRCEHKACSKLCSEDCDREPCDEPCKKTLKCGHLCVGFCGEPCPPLCRVCDKEELTEFQLYGNEEDEDARFIYLEDCKHTIEVEGLTYHMQLEMEEGEIGAKACPKCKTIIRHSKRYGHILRRRLGDVMKVKKKAFGDQEIIQPKQRELVLEILGNVEWIQVISITNPEVKNYFLDKLAQTLPRPQDKPQIKLIKMPAVTFRSLELIATHGKDVVRLHKASKILLRPEDFASLTRKYGRLFKQLLSRTLPLTKTEMENFESEFDRHHDICETFKRRGSANFTNGHTIATPLYKRATNLVLSLRPYSKTTKDLLHSTLKDLDNTLKTGLGISDRERREILAALNMAPGRWFKCPNGHIYIITECGGATQESTCNECGAAIGGSGHRTRSDNRLASEMDGALAPLYPQ